MAHTLARLSIPVLGLWLALSGRGVAAQTLGDDPAFATFRQASEAFARQEYRQAESFAREAVAHYPQHLLAHYLLGEIALAEARWDEAIQAFATVVSLYPGCFVAHRDLGIALDQANRLDEAATAYHTALTIRPENEDVQARLAFLHVQAGRREAALSLLKPLADRSTTMPEVWVVLGRLWYDTREYAASEKALRRATELRDDGPIWFSLGAVRLHLEDWQGARAAFEQAARHTATREQARRELDKLRQHRQDIEPAQRRPGAARR
jgi:tetratricopeptide (TPR) repeat protein